MRWMIGLGFFGLLVGCAGGKDTGTDTDTGTSTGDEVPADVQAVFDSHCSGCHTDGGSSGGLNLDDGNSYGTLVDVAAGVGGTRVTCGDSAGSVLFSRIDAGTMPPAGRLDPEDPITTIQEWIDGC